MTPKARFNFLSANRIYLLLNVASSTERTQGRQQKDKPKTQAEQMRRDLVLAIPIFYQTNVFVVYKR